MDKVRKPRKTFHEIYRICTVCNIEKHREEFKHDHRLYADGTSRVYPKCQLCFNEENRKYWREEERRKIRAGYCKKWRTKNKTLYLKTRSKESYKRSDNITDSYCIRQIKQGSYEMLKGVTIPPELIELQRVRIKALRALGSTSHKKKRIYD